MIFFFVSEQQSQSYSELRDSRFVHERSDIISQGLALELGEELFLPRLGAESQHPIVRVQQQPFRATAPKNIYRCNCSSPILEGFRGAIFSIDDR